MMEYAIQFFVSFTTTRHEEYLTMDMDRMINNKEVRHYFSLPFYFYKKDNLRIDKKLLKEKFRYL